MPNLRVCGLLQKLVTHVQFILSVLLYFYLFYIERYFRNNLPMFWAVCWGSSVRLLNFGTLFMVLVIEGKGRHLVLIDEIKSWHGLVIHT